MTGPYFSQFSRNVGGGMLLPSADRTRSRSLEKTATYPRRIARPVQDYQLQHVITARFAGKGRKQNRPQNRQRHHTKRQPPPTTHQTGKPRGPLSPIFKSRARISSIFGVGTAIFLLKALQRRWVAKPPTCADGF